MDLLGTFRVKLASTGFKKNANLGKLPRKWLNIDIFSKEEKYQLVIEKEEITKIKRSRHPQVWLENKNCWIRDDKKGEYRIWKQTKIVEVKKYIKSPKTITLVKIHGTSILIDLNSILAWKLQDKERVLTIFNDINNFKFIIPGPTPIPRPFRNLAKEEQIKRLEYLKSFGYQENILNVITRGYSAKDIKQYRQKLAKKDPITGKKKLASKEETEKFLKDKIQNRKHQREKIVK